MSVDFPIAQASDKNFHLFDSKQLSMLASLIPPRRFYRILGITPNRNVLVLKQLSQKLDPVGVSLVIQFFLVVQRLHLSMQEVQVPSLVRETKILRATRT